jgi:hypothetical protein
MIILLNFLLCIPSAYSELVPGQTTSLQKTKTVNIAGKVHTLRGQVKRIINNRPDELLKKDAVLYDRDVIQTLKNSGIKILLQDNSILSLSENSRLLLEASQPDVIRSVKLQEGNLRSKILKNYLTNQGISEKVKFLVKTPTTVMGVRGTDFTTVFNPQTKITSLITFEGAVTIAKINTQALNGTLSTDALVQTLNIQGQTVTAGNFSTVVPQLPTATAPTRLSPQQFQILEGQDPATGKRQLPSTGGSEEHPTSSILAPVNTKQETKGILPPAGGFIDLSTGAYISPPNNSKFDSATQTYVPPSSLGTLDPNTGSFKPAGNTSLESIAAVSAAAMLTQTTTPLLPSNMGPMQATSINTPALPNLSPTMPNLNPIILQQPTLMGSTSAFTLGLNGQITTTVNPNLIETVQPIAPPNTSTPRINIIIPTSTLPTQPNSGSTLISNNPTNSF